MHFLLRLWVLLKCSLLLPLLPALAWGPFTHPYINRRALEKAGEALASGDTAINAETYNILRRHQNTYIGSANSADAVSAYHCITGLPIYDYAHNNFPDNAAGIPLFGYRLINEWKQGTVERYGHRLYSERDFAVACGWLSHQIADWYAHYAAVKPDGQLASDPCVEPDGVHTFGGYSNSHRVFGTSFYPEVLTSQNLIDHALVEFFHDMLMREEHGDLVAAHPLVFFETYGTPQGETYNLLTNTSELYGEHHSRIHPDQIPVLDNNLVTVVNGMRVLMDLLRSVHPTILETIRASLSPTRTGLPDYIELAARRVVDHLFARSDDEILILARGPLPEQRFPGLEVRDVSRAGTIFFNLAHHLGTLLGSNSLIPLINSGETLNLRLFWGAFDLRTFSVRQLIQLMASPRLGDVLPDSRAVLCFLAELIRSQCSHFAPALARYRRLVCPVISLPGPTHWTDEEKIAAMLARSEISLIFAPALDLDAPFAYPYKDLDLRSLVMRIDGYDAEDLPIKYSVDRQWNGRRLTLTCRLRKPFCSGYHHLFAAVSDRHGIPAKNLEKEIYIRE